MQSLRQVGAGILLGAVSVIIVIGGLALALAEGGFTPSAAVSTDIPAEDTPSGVSVTLFPTLPLLTFTDTPLGPTFTVTVSLTPPPTLANCPPPSGWLPIVIQSYDTLDSLAQTYRTTADLLRVSNCLLNEQLIAGSILYVPPQPTLTLIPCGAPLNWVNYTVKAGDTLYRIGLLYRVTPDELIRANCLTNSVIRVGQILKVPNVPTSTAPVPAASNTPIPTPTMTEIPVVTLTLTPGLPTPTGTPLPTATATEIPSATTAPSQTPLPSVTPTTPSPNN